MPHFLKKIQKNTWRYQNFEKMKEKKTNIGDIIQKLRSYDVWLLRYGV